jgi:glycosyltransferase involved in cell wall biosynthesis
LTRAMRKQVLVNCSNLHVGGGVAVATSFVDCLSSLKYSGIDIHLLLSSEVSRNLSELGTNLEGFSSCIVRDYFGMSALLRGLNLYFREKDLVFTVFGPAYYLFSSSYHLVGFAQPNIIYPNNPISQSLSLFDRSIFRIKYKIQRLFFSRTDSIVVELEHVKTGLERLVEFAGIPIFVVYSSVHSIYLERQKWIALRLPQARSKIKLGIISRNYPHKNLKILTEVKKCLLTNFNLSVDFYVTFQLDEWESCDEIFRREIINVGGLSMGQCPTFYDAMDGVVFPSLLECFSAVPIEAMMVGKPLFASNLSFIRDVFGVLQLF